MTPVALSRFGRLIVAAAIVGGLAGCALSGAEPERDPAFGLGAHELDSLIAELDIPAGASVLVGAGDIARCDAPAPARVTGAIVAAVMDAAAAARVITMGDHAYEFGSAEEFERCYEPAWGAFNAVTRPTPGNHDYGTEGAEPYYEYFELFDEKPDARARGGYYSYALGGWHVVALNSLLPLDAGSEQLEWLAADLRAARAACILAYWHHPLFSSGYHGLSPWDRGRDLADAWRVLADHGADIVVNGHEHLYERFAPQSAAGEPVPDGLRQFVVGTGGGELQPAIFPRGNSEFVYADGYGVLVIVLGERAYEWAFLGTDGRIHDRSAAPERCGARRMPARRTRAHGTWAHGVRRTFVRKTRVHRKRVHRK